MINQIPGKYQSDPKENLPMLLILIGVCLMFFFLVMVPNYQITLDPTSICTLSDENQKVIRRSHCLGVLVGKSNSCECWGIKFRAR